MTRILFLGDTHGNLNFLTQAMGEALDQKCDAVFQVGDFGFLWPRNDQMAAVSSVARLCDIPLYWIDGNHDWHPEIRKRSNGSGPFGVHHVGRGDVVHIGGSVESSMTICGLGGAPSIDYAHRTAGKSWWPEEEITQAEVALVAERTHQLEVDVFVTHDAPFRPKGFHATDCDMFNVKSTRSNDFVRSAWKSTGAPILVHGHWHKRYTSKVDEGTIIGLDCDFGKFLNSFVILEKDDSGRMSIV